MKMKIGDKQEQLQRASIHIGIGNRQHTQLSKYLLKKSITNIQKNKKTYAKLNLYNYSHK